MKKLLVIAGLSVIAMAGKCGSDKSSESETKIQEEFPVKEESQVPAEEVPSYEQEPGASSSTTPQTPETQVPTDDSAPAETAPAPTPGN